MTYIDFSRKKKKHRIFNGMQIYIRTQFLKFVFGI